MKASFSRTLALGSAALILGLSSLGASALEIGEQDKVQVSGTAYRLAPYEFEQYGNSYKLDTGDIIKLRQQIKTRRYFTQIKGHPEVEMYAKGEGVFETADGARLEFRNEADQILVTGLDKLPGSLVRAGEDSKASHYAAR